MTDVAAYCARLGVPVPEAPSADWLQRVHLAHLASVPFENLDIHADVPIVLEPDRLVAKVVDRGRGGYCYELNGALAELLDGVGYDVRLAQCRVAADDDWSPAFDHLALLVSVDRGGADRPWLVDVGFGDSFVLPRRLGATWSEPSGRFRTVPVDGGWRLERDQGDGWAPRYLLDPVPRRLDEFAPRSHWHETSHDSPFRRGPLATLATPAGRVTVTGEQLVVTSGDDREERELPDAAARRAVVRAWFGPAVADAVEAALSR